jgi:hypothetical protein
LWLKKSQPIVWLAFRLLSLVGQEITLDQDLDQDPAFEEEGRRCRPLGLSTALGRVTLCDLTLSL